VELSRKVPRFNMLFELGLAAATKLVDDRYRWFAMEARHLQKLVRVYRQLSKAARTLERAHQGASLFDRNMFEELVAAAMGIAAKVVH
jgi:hypothetical protein